MLTKNQQNEIIHGQTVWWEHETEHHNRKKQSKNPEITKLRKIIIN